MPVSQGPPAPPKAPDCSKDRHDWKHVGERRCKGPTSSWVTDVYRCALCGAESED